MRMLVVMAEYKDKPAVRLSSQFQRQQHVENTAATEAHVGF